MSYTDRRTTKADESHLEPETEDSLGYSRDTTPTSELDLPVVDTFFGAVSESLVIALQQQHFDIVGDDLSGIERTYRLELSNKKFIMAELVLFGFRTGRRVCIAVKADNGGWYYTAKFQNRLESATSPSQWMAKVHTFHRI